MIPRATRAKHIFAAALAVALLLGASSAADAKPADPNWTCRLRHPATYVDSLKKLPRAIQADLKKTVGAMADRGEFFNATDVVMRKAPFNRFIRGGQSHGQWFVWYEHGGFAYWRQIVFYTGLGLNGGKITVRVTGPDLCAITDRFLDGPKR